MKIKMYHKLRYNLIFNMILGSDSMWAFQKTVVLSSECISGSHMATVLFLRTIFLGGM